MLRDLLFAAVCIAVGYGAGYWLAVRRDTRVRRRAGLAEYHVHVTAPSRDTGEVWDEMERVLDRRQRARYGTAAGGWP